LETRANYILIGAFTIAGFIGVLAFFLWFARVELDRQFAYYDIRFSSVSGLGNASDVRFSGLPVGQVVDVRLAPDQDGSILVRVEVAAETPVRSDSIATIEAQGVTGVSFVSIGAGSPDAPLLVSTQAVPIPEIEAGRSTLQSLSEDAPQLVSETLQVVQEIGQLLGNENQGRLENILLNIESASADFAQTLKDFSSVAATVTSFTEEISRFNATLEMATGELTGVLKTTDTTIASIGELSEEARVVVSKGSTALDSVQETIIETERYISEDLTGTTETLRQMVVELQAQVTSVGDDAKTLMSTLGTTGSTATARLEEARTTLTEVDALIARLDETATILGGTAARLDGLIETEGGPLLSETRAMVNEAKRAIQTVNAVADTDLPAIFSDIRAAAQKSSQTITDVGANLTSASGRIDEIANEAGVALGEATRAFGNANETLAAINAALETGDRALSAAERAFLGADRVINEDISGVITGLETSLKTLNTAVAGVSEDLPLISADLRSASQSAADAFAELRSIANSAAPSVREFASTALPLYTRLAQESRALIANLDRLAEQIERDPTRFFLDRQTPEFRR
jgi:phospholipid/cholesterol/gamma-HCH transport system substrate-binding protein